MESEKQTSSTQISQSSENIGVLAFQIKIVEYSPEWDFVEGGAKFVLCYQPMIELHDCQILFGNKLVEARCLQPGVMKAFGNPSSFDVPSTRQRGRLREDQRVLGW